MLVLGWLTVLVGVFTILWPDGPFAGRDALGQTLRVRSAEPCHLVMSGAVSARLLGLDQGPRELIQEFLRNSRLGQFAWEMATTAPHFLDPQIGPCRRLYVYPALGPKYLP